MAPRHHLLCELTIRQRDAIRRLIGLFDLSVMGDAGRQRHLAGR
jgi:hypothetical protein